jgi:O-antigen ligase/Tfp pilus assembly protein PilF
MKDTSRQTAISEPNAIVRTIAFWLCLSLLVFVPLAFSTSVYRIFSLPKFLILLSGSAALVPLIVFIAQGAGRHIVAKSGSKHVLLVSAYVALIAVSTVFGAAPVASLFGSFENQMGLVTRLCFYLCFLAIICGIGQSWTRLMQTLWAMSITGLCAATYAFAQFFGRDWFLPSSLYMFNSMGETVVRPIGTLGHADYLGNFLLYTTPLCVGFALNSSGRTRRFGMVAAAVSTAAIAFSGTRGAWVGLIVGGGVFVVLELPRKFGELHGVGLRSIALRLTIACFLVLLSVLLIASNPASRNMVVRARLFMTEGFTGAGRTLLWRDSLKMAPDFVVTGCGPEGFRKAFLAYKSKELARFAPDINNESSHNSFLDAAISFGLLGAGLYAAIIASTLSLLRRTRRRVDRRRRVIITGLLSSFAAVTAHNFFIFDQIPTGLYFFGFLALAYAVANAADVEAPQDARLDEHHRSESVREKDAGQAPSGNDNKRAVMAISVSGVALLASASYSLFAMNADKQLNTAFVAANQGNLDQVISCVNGATSFFGATGESDFAAARALTLCAERIKAGQDSSQPRVGNETLAQAKATAIDLAMIHANKSLARTLEPDSNNLLLAYLAFLGGDAAKLREYASEAVKLDPYFPNARWLMAEAYLAEGDREHAAREAEIALEISPSLRQAKSALVRAGGATVAPASVEKSLERGRQLLSEGKIEKAERVLLRAIRKSSGRCAECHRLLATVYEQANLFVDAITEWQSFLRETPDRATAEQTARHIEMLKQKTAQ